MLGVGGVGQVEPIVAGGADAGSHFAGGGVGERDGDELAEPGGIAVLAGAVEVGDEALGEDESFAAARTGGEGDRSVAAIDGRVLFGGEGRGGHGV